MQHEREAGIYARTVSALRTSTGTGKLGRRTGAGLGVAACTASAQNYRRGTRQAEGKKRGEIRGGCACEGACSTSEQRCNNPYQAILIFSSSFQCPHIPPEGGGATIQAHSGDSDGDQDLQRGGTGSEERMQSQLRFSRMQLKLVMQPETILGGSRTYWTSNTSCKYNGSSSS
eukprot:746328-Pelagomonas_calceolata.AAC.1